MMIPATFGLSGLSGLDGLDGLGANVTLTGQVNNPFWCALLPTGWGGGACTPPTAEELAVAQANLAECAQMAKTTYPTTSALLGTETACRLVAGDYNGGLAIGAAVLGLLLFTQMR